MALAWARIWAISAGLHVAGHGLGAQLGDVQAAALARHRRRTAVHVHLDPAGQLHVAGLHVGRAGALVDGLQRNLVDPVRLRHGRAGRGRGHLHLVVGVEVAGGRAVGGHRARVARLADRMEVPAAAQFRGDLLFGAVVGLAGRRRSTTSPSPRTRRRCTWRSSGSFSPWSGSAPRAPPCEWGASWARAPWPSRAPQFLWLRSRSSWNRPPAPAERLRSQGSHASS